MADFADKLGLAMAAGGHTQSALARDSGVPQTTISAYLKRVNRPSWDHVQALARALKITCIDLEDDPLAPGGGESGVPSTNRTSARPIISKRK